MSSEWTMQPAGLSRDGRTNVWCITPPCGHRPFSPQTTRFAVQHVSCPKCGVSAVAYYNQDRIVPEAAA